MAVSNISEADAVRDLPGLLAKVRQGTEVVIDDGSSPIAVLQQPQTGFRLLSESIAMAKQHAQELGYEPVMDEDFARDMREIIASRKPRVSAWDDR